MINLLPAELGILIIEYLSLHEIATVQRVCSQWRDFIQDNADSIYFAAAAFHDYNGTGIDCNSMKELCQRKRRIERALMGHAPATISFHVSVTTEERAVHHFKVDEKNNLVICSYITPGIRVWDLKTGILIWELLDVQHFRIPIAIHVDYSNGFFVFNDGGRERVWRHSLDFGGPPPPPLDASYDDKRAVRQRGVFHPWADFTPPTGTNAFKLVYPTLVAASNTEAYLWDVPTARLTCTIRDIQGLGSVDDIGSVFDVDLNRQHIVVCGQDGVGIYTRPREGQKNVQASELKVLLLCAADYPAEIAPNYCVSHQTPRSTMDQPAVEQLALEILDNDSSYIPEDQPQPDFAAARIDEHSACLAVLLAHSRLLIIPNPSAPNAKERIISFQLGPVSSWSECLAFEHGRVAVGASRGAFIVQLAKYSPLDANTHLYPTRVSLVHVLKDRDDLAPPSCLVWTEDGLWMNWLKYKDTRTWILDEFGDWLAMDMDTLGVTKPLCVCRVGFDALDEAYA